MVILYAARHQLRALGLARWLLSLGIVATLAAAYRASIDNGKPISERRLAAMFGKTSRRWARRIGS